MSKFDCLQLWQSRSRCVRLKIFFLKLRVKEIIKLALESLRKGGTIVTMDMIFLVCKKRIYILSLRHYLACRGMKPMMNFFSEVGLFFPRPKGGQLFSRGCRPTGGQGKKRSPTKETKSSSKVSVSSTAAKYHVLEDRYIFLLNYHTSNQAILNG